jgi:hypothetical protein
MAGSARSWTAPRAAKGAEPMTHSHSIASFAHARMLGFAGSLVLILCSCSSEAPVPGPNSQAEQNQEGAAAPAVAPGGAGEEQSVGAATAAGADVNASTNAGANASRPRCGWIENPTPGNWSLVDRDGEWLIGAQGGYQAPGLDEFPDLTEGEWKVTNGSSYGYGCACLDAKVDASTRRVERIDHIRQKPLRACSADPALPRR